MLSRSFALFATHFHEMTRLSDELSGRVGNLFCDARVGDGQFTLLYSVREGACQKSFGLAVAKLAGFPDEVLEDAKGYLELAEKERWFEGGESKRQRVE